MDIRVFLLDDHEIVRTGLRSLLEADRGLRGGRGGGHCRRGPGPDPAHPTPMWPSSMSACPTAAASRSAARSVQLAGDRLRHAHLLRRRRGTLRRRHGRGAGLRPEAGRRQQPGRATSEGGGRPVAARPASPSGSWRGCGTEPDEDPRWPASPPRSAASSTSSPRARPTARSPRTMFLAEKTVKNYVSNLLAKLGMERRTQAATYATRVAERTAQAHRADAAAPDPSAPGTAPGPARPVDPVGHHQPFGPPPTVHPGAVRSADVARDPEDRTYRTNATS